ncbi:MAG: NAD(P)(+) transhydrogenase (Re/Si-specific) subunit alpha, partial [Rhodospirillales bacterium]|nr:NAD(P)(+) transhydrogenase (Re/Si-specific) subunit alpha [Rhodospirillales bacterium]
MKIAIPKERAPGETRIAASPDMVKKFVGFGFDVVVEKDAGIAAAMTDADFEAVGATIAKDEATALKDADVIFKIQRPTISGKSNELALMKSGAILVGHLSALTNREDVEAYAKAG